MSSSFEVLFDIIEEYAFLLENDGTIIKANQSALNALGYTNDEFKGRNINSFGKEKNSIINFLNKLINNNINTTKLSNINFITKDGQLLNVNLTISTVEYHNEEKLLGICNNTIDEKIKKSEEHYRTLYNSLQIGYCLCKMIFDENGKAKDYLAIDMNPAYEKLRGIKATDYVGKLNSEVQSDKNTFEYWIKLYARIVLEGKNLKYEEYLERSNKYLEMNIYKLFEDRFAIVVYDITDRKQMEKSIYEEKEKLQITLQSIEDAVIVVDNNNKIVMYNNACEKLTGFTSLEAIGNDLCEIIKIKNQFGFEIGNNLLDTHKESSLDEYSIIVAKDGTNKYVKDKVSPFMDNEHKFEGIVITLRDISDERKHIEKMEYLNIHDNLTGLYNRRFLDDKLSELENSTEDISFIMGDVNGLKVANDVFGHKEGDNILITIANILTKCSRENDFVIRFAGDEFIVILLNTKYEIANKICDSIYSKIEEFDYSKSNVFPRLSISLGVATRKKNEETNEEALKNAENFMYKRKLLESKSNHSSLVSSIRRTLDEKNLENDDKTNRLKVLCLLIAKKIDLPKHMQDDLILLSMLHDIGKIAINDEILNKTTVLSDEDWKEVKRHCEIGYRIAGASSELMPIADLILSHHERWDGNGYPQGLKGDAIPLLSRIMSIVDAYDAMTNDKPYRKAISAEDAKKELLSNSGAQFDPNIIRAMINILK